VSRPGADARRFVSYRDGSEVRAGVLVGGLVFDAANLARRSRYATMRGVLSEWDAAQHAFDEALAAGSALQCRSFRLEDITLAAPVPEPGDIFAAGANYDDHIEEMARIMNQPLGPNMKQLGDKPWHFVKTGRSSIVGPGAEVPMPSHSRAVDWEIELAAVIGRPAKDVSVEHALDHVAGYTIANDLSARDVIRREKNPPTSPFHYDWISIKCFDGSCPTGPWIVPRNESFRSAAPGAQAVDQRRDHAGLEHVEDDLRRRRASRHAVFAGHAAARRSRAHRHARRRRDGPGPLPEGR
jgi:2-keto-4-pentenoate hydratase/2-oxohepta-3-ene-1,7-dioic acid hydratase in catechol pathway